jgi:aerobic C4-dicarboxylate transport protein
MTMKTYGWVILALLLGALTGMLFPGFAVVLKPLGAGFIKLITMLVAPIVFCVVVSGICGAGDMKKAGRIGIKAIVYFEVMTTLAMGIGMLAAFACRLGAGMNVNPKTLDASGMQGYAAAAHQMNGIAGFLLGLIPTTLGDAFTRGDILQILVFAVPFAAALCAVGTQGRRTTELIESVQAALFKLMGFLVRLAPIGVFGSVASEVGQYGIGTLAQLGLLLGTFCCACALFVLFVLGALLRSAGFHIIPFIRYFQDELLIAAGTASSDAVLPQIMRKLEQLGVSRATVGLVIPTGYSFNLDGFSIYLTMATVFVAQATNTPLSFLNLLSILAVALIASKGAHGIPGSALVILAATLGANPVLPLGAIALLLGIDWFMGIGRTVTNLIGNCVATVVIAAWEKEINNAQARSILAEAAA